MQSQNSLIVDENQTESAGLSLEKELKLYDEMPLIPGHFQKHIRHWSFFPHRSLCLKMILLIDTSARRHVFVSNNLCVG